MKHGESTFVVSHVRARPTQRRRPVAPPQEAKDASWGPRLLETPGRARTWATEAGFLRSWRRFAIRRGGQISTQTRGMDGRALCGLSHVCHSFVTAVPGHLLDPIIRSRRPGATLPRDTSSRPMTGGSYALLPAQGPLCGIAIHSSWGHCGHIQHQLAWLEGPPIKRPRRICARPRDGPAAGGPAGSDRYRQLD